MSGRPGIATAVALAGGVGDREGASQQDTLFADLEDDVSVPALPLPNPPVQRARKGGRPPGARNRSTEEWRQLFLSRFRSPLMGLGEIYSMPLEDLARQLMLYKSVDVITIDPDTGRATRTRCEDRTLLDLERAFEIQNQARIAALPYLHQKQPQAVEVKGDFDGLGTLVLGAFKSQSASDDRGLPVVDGEAVEIVDITPDERTPAVEPPLKRGDAP